MNLINPPLVERQLREEFGPDQAALLTSLALGLGNLIDRDPVAGALLGSPLFPAIAVLYGSALRVAEQSAVATEHAVAAYGEQDGDALTIAAARQALIDMPKLVALTSAQDPAFTAAIAHVANTPQEDSISDILTRLNTTTQDAEEPRA